MKALARYQLARRARAKYAIAEMHTPDDVRDVCEAVDQIEAALRRELADLRSEIFKLKNKGCDE